MVRETKSIVKVYRRTAVADVISEAGMREVMLPWKPSQRFGGGRCAVLAGGVMRGRSCGRVVVGGLRRMGVGCGSRVPGVALLAYVVSHVVEHSVMVVVVFVSTEMGRWAP